MAQTTDQPEGGTARDVAAPRPAPVALDGHGWMTIRDDRDQSTILLHLPPRTAGGDEWGTVRIAPGVAGLTDGTATYGDRVWLALVPERGPADVTLRRIVSLSAERIVGGSWQYPPGRPEVLAPLPGRDEIAGFVGTARGPVALTRARVDRTSAEGEWSLHLLSGAAWKTLPLPWAGNAEPPAPGASVRLVSMGESLGLIVFPPVPGPWKLFKLRIPQDVSEDTAAEWSSESWPSTGAAGSGASAFAPDAVYLVDDGRVQQLVAATWSTDGSLRLVSLRASGASELATVAGVPREHRIAPMGATGSIAVLWWEVSAAKPNQPEPAPGSTAARKFTIVEVSAISGKELYRGENKGGGILSGSEFKLLAVVLLLVTTLVLLFALRAEPTARYLLPDGFVPADPLRRIIAAAADLVPGVVIAAFSMGLEPESMLSPAIFIGPQAEPFAWLLAIGLTILHCTLGESMTGRSIGKALSGCEVATMRRNPETGAITLGPVQIWQALVRNLIRWGVPILGILLLIDGGRRHPADAAARTIVVVRVEEPDDE